MTTCRVCSKISSKGSWVAQLTLAAYYDRINNLCSGVTCIKIMEVCMAILEQMGDPTA